MIGSRERYALEVTGLPGWSTPTVQRLRRFLKAARRQFGLRCTAVGEIEPAGDSGATDNYSKLVTQKSDRKPAQYVEHPFE